MVKPQRQYTVASWDPLYYRLFHRFIEGAKDLGIVQRVSAMGQKLPNVPVLPITFLAGFLSLVAIDAATHKSEAYDWNNNQPEQPETMQVDAVTSASPSQANDPSLQALYSFINRLNETELNSVLLSPGARPDQTRGNNVDTLDLRSFWEVVGALSQPQPTFTKQQQLEDRLTIDGLFEKYKRIYGLSGEVQEGLLLYAKDAARTVLKANGVGGMDAYTYGMMKPEVLATIHAIPGLPENIRNAFPALIGIESNFKFVLTSYAGACGLSQVMPGGGYADFLGFMVGSSKNARDYRAAFPRLIAGLDYVFEDMLHHVEARNLLGFYSDVIGRLDKQVDSLHALAKDQRTQKHHQEADQLEAQKKDANHLRNKVRSAKNFITMQLFYENDDFDISKYRAQKRKISNPTFEMDKLMQELVKDYPDLAQANHMQYQPDTDWVAQMDILDNFKKTWKLAKYHPILNPFIGASEFNYIYFRLARHEVVKEVIAGMDVKSEEERSVKAHELILALSLRSYNAGLGGVISTLNNHKLPKVAQGYVENHTERNRVLQLGHKQLYGSGGVDGAKAYLFESQIPRIADNYPGRNFYTTDVRNLVRSNTGSNAARRNF